jgi:hypothetical protein
MNQYIQHLTKDTKALRIDGDYFGPEVVIGNNLPFLNDTKTGGRTMAFWLSFNSFGPPEINNIIHSRDAANSATGIFAGIHFKEATETGGTERLAVFVRKSGTNRVCYGNTSLSLSTPYLLTISTNGSSYKMTVNAVNQTISLSTSRPGVNNGDWFGDTGVTMVNAIFGSNTLTTGSSTDADHRMFAYWDKELSSSEITELYNGGVVKDPTHLYTALQSLRCYYKFGEREDREGSIATIYDSIIPKNLTTSGMTTSNIITH